jgi:transcriptional/translational regulatory protein YebC/TACO1
METALEAGADDMQTEDDSYVIYTDPSAYDDVDQALRAAGYELVESEVEQVPSMESTPDEKDLRKLKKLVEVLEDNDDVQSVSTNCAVDLEDVED